MRAHEFIFEQHSRRPLQTLKSINDHKRYLQKKQRQKDERAPLLVRMYGRTDIEEREHDAEMAALEKRKLSAQVAKAEAEAKRVAVKLSQEKNDRAEERTSHVNKLAIRQMRRE